MSSQAVAWAIVMQAGGPSAKAVLMSIANYANAYGECWQDQKTLAEGAELQVRQFRNILRGLIERGLVEQVRRGGQGRGRLSDVLRLRMRELPAILTAKRREEGEEEEAEQPAISSNRQRLPLAQQPAKIAERATGNLRGGNRQIVAATVESHIPINSSSKSKRASARLSPDWRPRKDEVAFGVQGGLTEPEVFAAADHMRDWAEANNKTKASWDLTFRNWLRTAIADAKRGKRPVVVAQFDRDRALRVYREHGFWDPRLGPEPQPDLLSQGGTR